MTRTPSRRVSRSGSASALRNSSASAMLNVSAIVVGSPLWCLDQPEEKPHDGRSRQQVRVNDGDGGPLPSLAASHGPVPRQGRCAACSARRLAPPLRVTGPLRGRGDELGTKRSLSVPPLALGLGQCHPHVVGHRLVLLIGSLT